MKLNFETSSVSSEVLEAVRQEQQVEAGKVLALKIVADEQECQKTIDYIVGCLRNARRSEKNFKKQLEALKKAKNPIEFRHIACKIQTLQPKLKTSPEDYEDTQ